MPPLFSLNLAISPVVVFVGFVFLVNPWFGFGLALKLQPLMSFQLINPESLGKPRGYSNGVLTDGGGRLLFISGQIGWNEQQEIVSHDFVDQFDQALANVIAVVAKAGGEANQIARLVLYVTNHQEYLDHTREVGERYRKRMGKHYPAMVLVEVKGLLDPNAKVEIEGLAVL